MRSFVRAPLTVACIAGLVACGAPPPTQSPESEATAGGDNPSVDEAPLPSTVPVPVPQPAVARAELSPPLQQFWTRIEETVAISPPNGPADATEEAVQTWADGPFRDWITARREAMSDAIGIHEEVPEEPAYERAVAAALIGYAFEDFASDVRGSPVPADLAHDPELLAIYVANLREVLLPIANDAVVAYAVCQRRLAMLGDESEWLPWRAYCVQRGREVIEVFELAPPSR